MGGLKQRLLHCRERLIDYLNGAATEIVELKEEILDFRGRGKAKKAMRLTSNESIYYTDYNIYQDRPPYLVPWASSASVTMV